MLRQAFSDFIYSTNTDKSGKASSYGRALDMLGPILAKHYPAAVVNGSIWHPFRPEEIRSLHEWMSAEKRKGTASEVLADFDAPSYWTKNFCSAAVRAYGEFMAAEAFEDGIIAKVADETVGKAVARKTSQLIARTARTDLDEKWPTRTQEGKSRLAAVKVRVNQEIFRKMVLANYRYRCCVTGLAVPDVLRASHISPWAEDVENRLNPENGLCLSATYDAAFDRHLISFDEDYRLVVSRQIKDHYTDAAAKSYFLDLEGRPLALPAKFLPSKNLLAKHRALLAG
jgi:putative restriction endonuclease